MLIPTFIFGLKGAQLIIVILIVILLFGANRIPKLMRSLGKSVHAFKQGVAEAEAEIKKPVDKPQENTVKDTDDKDSK